RIVVPPGNILGASGDGSPSVAGPIPGLPPGSSSGSPSPAKPASGGGEGASAATRDGASKGAAPGAPAAGGVLPARASVASTPGVIIRPPDGNFDAVVVQSSGLDQFPETKNLLTGRPTYTV